MNWWESLVIEAQEIINKHHQDESSFFAGCNFDVSFIQETDDAFGFVDGTYPNYKIGLHTLLSKPTPENQDFIRMTIVHELLHIIHADWNEGQVANEEYRLANLAGYFQTLLRRDEAYLKRVRNLKDLE